MVDDYMTGISADHTSSPSTTSTGNYDYMRLDPQFMQPIEMGVANTGFIVKNGGDVAEPKKKKTNKMEVELCLCSKALWS